jgi:ribulose-phosphate 3-epimerase
MNPRKLEPSEKISPSILSADFSRLGEEVQAVEKAGADYIHVDVMDGHFVPNLTIGPAVVESLRRRTSLPLDVHLMIQNPDEFLAAFIEAGASILTVHVEACPDPRRTLTAVKRGGARAGVSLNPATPVALIKPDLAYADLVLVMTVNPGFGGQALIPAVLPKVEQLRSLIDQEGWNLELEVDGGIKVDNVGAVARAGADVFVSGSGIFKSSDYAGTIRAMRDEITRHKTSKRRY